MCRRMAVLVVMCLALAAPGPASAPLPGAAVRAFDGIGAEDPRTYVGTLASDDFNGRGVGDAGNRAAEEYACATLSRSGVTPAGADGSCYQPADVYRPVLGPAAHLTIASDEGPCWPIWRPAKTLSAARNGRSRRHGPAGVRRVRAVRTRPGRRLHPGGRARRHRPGQGRPAPKLVRTGRRRDRRQVDGGAGAWRPRPAHHLRFPVRLSTLWPEFTSVRQAAIVSTPRCARRQPRSRRFPSAPRRRCCRRSTGAAG